MNYKLKYVSVMGVINVIVNIVYGIFMIIFPNPMVIFQMLLIDILLVLWTIAGLLTEEK